MIQRALLGFPLGMAIAYAITIGLSLVYGKGYYTPAVPEFIDYTGSEIHAVVLQALLCGILGTVCAMLSMIWEQESWSILKQTFIFFTALSLTMLPIAYILYWMEHSLLGFLRYFVIFFMIFVLIWIIQYVMNRHSVMQINKKLK